MPRRTLLSVAALGAVAVVLGQGLTPVSADLSRIARTLLAALVIGAVGRMLAHRSGAPAALWMVPAILPLLPSPSTLVPQFAETEAARQALEGQAGQTAFAIGVGVASGDIAVATYQRYRERVLEPVAGVVSDGLSTYVVRPAKRMARWWRRKGRAAGGRGALNRDYVDEGEGTA